MNRPLCIYHGGCNDGFAAAWCVRKALRGDLDFFPGVHQEEPPAHNGRTVILVDFCYRREILEAMSRTATSIVVFDHHKSTQEDLAGVGPPPDFQTLQDSIRAGERRGFDSLTAVVDLDRCGAMIAWNYFFGANEAPPRCIEYIQDRDLWLKRLPGSDEFTIALRSYPQTFSVWDSLMSVDPNTLLPEGNSIQRYHRLRTTELVDCAYQATLGGHTIWIANAPAFAAGDVANELAARDVAFGACYLEVASGLFQYELRSRGDFDVSEVARRYGGGGHKNAAGFRTRRLAHEAAVAVRTGTILSRSM